MPLAVIIHSGADGEIGGVLFTAVQHHDQWNWVPGVAGRDVEIVAAGPGRLGVGEVADLALGGPRGSCGVGGRTSDDGAGERAKAALQMRDRLHELSIAGHRRACAMSAFLSPVWSVSVRLSRQDGSYRPHRSSAYSGTGAGEPARSIGEPAGSLVAGNA
jgi:hypothetical protein